MAVVPRFNGEDIKKALAIRAERIEKAIIRRLLFLGEKCLNECRNNKTYIDRTGNLTSSMGYVVVANGSIVDVSGFNQGVTSTLNGTAHNAQGNQTGEQLARKLAAEYRTGYALIVVAGMDYAAHVEAKGYNVLASAELLAERELPKMMAALAKNIEKMS